MDAFIDIFGKLGSDITVFYQFGIFLVLYFILKTVFFNKLQFVLEIRDNKTVKLKDSAEKKFQKAKALEEEYLAKMKMAKAKAAEELRQYKDLKLKEQTMAVKNTRDKVEKNLEKEVHSFHQLLQTKRKSIFANVGNFSKNILQRIGK